MDADRGPPPAEDAGIEYVVLGGPEDGPTLRLDHECFAYAGKFVLSTTGKAVARTIRAGDPVPSARHRAAGGEAGHAGDEYDDDVLAAVAFDRDRTDATVLRIRYVTVRRDRRGEGLGSRLLAFVAKRALADAAGAAGEADALVRIATEAEPVRIVRIAVNNPFAYEAAYKAGFGYTGERTGLAELRCDRPGDRSPERYREGLAAFRERESLGASERAFLADRLRAGPPPTVEPPTRS